MTYIEVDCQDQDLTVVDAPLIASGDVLTDKVHFTFCPKWDGFAKTAVFYRDGVDNLEVLIDEDNECIIPKEVLQSEGTFYFGVFGVKGNEVKTSEVMRYKVRLGAVSGTLAPEPTPDIYTQLLTKIEEAGILFTRATEEEITSILGSGAEGTGVVTVSRLNQFKVGYDSNMKKLIDEKIDEKIDSTLVETENTYEYGGV